MDKKQFINELVDALAGEVPSQVISENVNYYRNYFVEESAKSHRSEKEIIEELGSPRLIARSIIDAYQAEHGPYSGDSSEKSTTTDDGETKVSNHSSSGCGVFAFIVVMVAFLVVMTVMRVILSIPGLIILIVLALVLAFYRSGRR